MSKTNEKGINSSGFQLGSEFKEIFDNLPIWIVLCSKEGNVTNVTKSALKIMGISKLKNILGYNLFDYPLIEEKEELLNKCIIKFQSHFRFTAAFFVMITIILP